MNRDNIKGRHSIFISLLAGWLSLVGSFGAWVFLPIHGYGFAPEIGPLGASLFFGGIMTLLYIADFTVAIFVYFLVSGSALARAKPYMLGLIGACLFGLTVPLWCALFSGAWRGIGYNSLYFLPYALLSGFFAFYILHRIRRMVDQNTLPA
ncbi:MAG TPA: hypothetical protein VNV14_01770 [Opitutaceae bacterium]|jgi:hypothetical protein|nr:hypothetical protein [Opitutaceae bacterium]